jgi:hypothetical protein
MKKVQIIIEDKSYVLGFPSLSMDPMPGAVNLWANEVVPNIIYALVIKPVGPDNFS